MAKTQKKTGRPPKWSTPEDLQQQIDSYFEYCEENTKRPSKAGLYAHLDSARETLHEYSQKPEFADTIKTAYRKIEAEWVDRLNDGAPAGAIFYLKNAFGYRDRIETDITTKDEAITAPTSDSDIAAIAAEAAAILRDRKL